MSSSDSDVKSIKEVYPCFIQVTDDECAQDGCIELPTEKYGTMLLSTIQAQFPNAIGLKYKTATGNWRGIRLSENILDPPFEGWGEIIFQITLPKTTDSVKRKMEESANREPEAKLVKTGGSTSADDYLSDLIVLGLPYKATEEDMREYFEQFGELSMLEVKMDSKSNKSRGFGFIRYKNATEAQKVLKMNHSILGRRCEVRLPKRKDEMPLKLFVGRLPDGTTKENLTEYFESYGDLTDVYIPNPFRGFGFVTFASSEVARHVLNITHSYKNSRINVTYAEPKGFETQSSSRSSSGGGGGGRYSRGDPPFDFEDMRQIMSRSSYSHMYAPSSKSSRRYDARDYSSSSPGMPYESRSNNMAATNFAEDSRATAMAYGSAMPNMGTLYNGSTTPNIAYQPQTSDQQRLQYGFWSNSK